MRESELWESLELPEWDAERLYALFLIHRGEAEGRAEGPTEPERDEYARRLMSYIAMRFRHHRFLDSLPAAGLCVQGTAQDVLAKLVEKTPRFRMRKPCYKVMLCSLQTAIQRLVVEQLRRRPRCETTATDVREGAGTTAPEGAGIDPLDARVGHVRTASLAALSAALHDEASLDQALRGVAGDVFTLEKLYRLQRRRLLRDNDLAPRRQLPPRLRERVTDGQHNLVTARLRRLAYGLARRV